MLITRWGTTDVNLKATLCVSCSKVHLAKVKLVNNLFSLALTLHCVGCYSTWTVCRQCSTHWTKMTKHHMLNKHNKLYHQMFSDIKNWSTIMRLLWIAKNPQLTMIASALSHPVHSTVITKMKWDMEHLDNSGDVLPTSNREIISFGNHISNAFFTHDQRKTEGGSTYIFTRAVTETAIFI